jgi:hypothetical protein
LGERSAQELRAQIDKLMEEHSRELAALRRSGTYFGLLYFVGGVVLGVVGNVVVNLVML